MRNLLQFLLKNITLLLFLGLEVVSFVLLVENNQYQKCVVINSSNEFVGQIYKLTNSVTDYFSLQRENEWLSEENAELNNKLAQLESRLRCYGDSALYAAPTYISASCDRKYIPAKVINLSTSQFHNYLTIDKGSRDGVAKDMGVVNADGVVGIVSQVSERFAVIIPLLNTEMAISAKFKKNNYSGPIQWDGKDHRYAQMNDIARHIEVEPGDTIVTSGYTSIFPEGIPVGIVETVEIAESADYHHIDIRLAVDFRRLGYVQVINNHTYQEQKSLEVDSIHS